MDDSLRCRVIETMWLFWTFVLVGFDNGILGPCLPDLQKLVQASLRQMSYVFFVQGTGGLVGFAAGLLLEKHFDRRLLLGLYVIAGSVVNIALPLVPSYLYVLGMFLLQGLTKGLADFEAMSLCNMLWKGNKALPFQFIVAGAGIATFLSSFIAQPFISDRSSVRSSIHSSSSATDWCPRYTHNNVSSLGVTSFTNQSDSASGATDGADVRIPFMIVGAVTSPAGVAFFYYFFRRRGYNEQDVSVSDDDVMSLDTCSLGNVDQTTGLLSGKNTSKQMETAFKLIVLILHIPVFGLLLTFADLLTSVAMMSPLCMTPAEASYFVIVLWGAAALARAVNGVMAICVPMFYLLLFNSISLIGCGIALVWNSSNNALALWFGTAGVGFFLTPSMPGYLAWSSEFTPVTSTFLSLCLCLSGVGEMLLPFLGGQLMAVYGKNTLMVFSLITMIIMPVLLLFAYAVGKRLPRT